MRAAADSHCHRPLLQGRSNWRYRHWHPSWSQWASPPVPHILPGMMAWALVGYRTQAAIWEPGRAKGVPPPAGGGLWPGRRSRPACATTTARGTRRIRATSDNLHYARYASAMIGLARRSPRIMSQPLPVVCHALVARLLFGCRCLINSSEGCTHQPSQLPRDQAQRRVDAPGLLAGGESLFGAPAMRGQSGCSAGSTSGPWAGGPAAMVFAPRVSPIRSTYSSHLAESLTVALASATARRFKPCQI